MGWGKKLLSPLIWGNLIAMMLVGMLIIAGVWTGLNRYTRHGEQIEVPDVGNKLIGDAEYTLEMEELKPVVVDSTFNRSLLSGTVVNQVPKPGTKVKAGRQIYLTINAKESPTVALPDIADNCSLREAQDRLRQLGFRLGPVEHVPGDKDWIYGVKCQGRLVHAGQRVPADAVITLLVGSDPGNEDDLDLDMNFDIEENEMIEDIISSHSDHFDYD